jgi:hypothetical protein
LKARANGHSAPDVRVTIRFVGYEAGDQAIVAQIEEILKRHTKWHFEPLDGGNNPALRPSVADDFKVVFVSNISANFNELHSIFQDGLLINGLRYDQIARREDLNRADSTHLVIEVLPTVKR